MRDFSSNKGERAQPWAQFTKYLIIRRKIIFSIR